MAWPPPLPPATRNNLDDQLDLHPTDHNQIHRALADIVALLNTRDALTECRAVAPPDNLAGETITLNGSLPVAWFSGQDLLTIPDWCRRVLIRGTHHMAYIQEPAGVLIQGNVGGSTNDAPYMPRLNDIGTTFATARTIPFEFWVDDPPTGPNRSVILRGQLVGSGTLDWTNTTAAGSRTIIMATYLP